MSASRGIARTARRRFVVLAAHEWHTLAEIERQFIDDDPQFRQSSTTLGSDRRTSAVGVCDAARQPLERPS
jgi:hypothetical protein